MSKFTIVMIEDEKNICNFIESALERHDYKVNTAYNGRDGLALINSLCPDVILLDLGLPDLDGIDIIKSVRSWTSIPIIVISARTQEHEKVAALDFGADDYITKPFGTSELLARSALPFAMEGLPSAPWMELSYPPPTAATACLLILPSVWSHLKGAKSI